MRSRFSQGPDVEEGGSRAGDGGAAGRKGAGGPHRAEEDLQPFLRCLSRLGFSLVSLDTSNRMFFVAVLRKLNAAPAGQPAPSIAWPELRPCVYKRR